MALYAIGDTHLSLSSGKPMDVFGGGWTGYVDKLKEGFSPVSYTHLLEIIRDWRRWKRALLSLWGLPAMKLYLEMTALLASDGVYSGRTEMVTVNTPY